MLIQSFQVLAAATITPSMFTLRKRLKRNRLNW